MSQAARIREADIARAIKAFGKAGVNVVRGRINPDGSIELLTGEAEAANDKDNPLDRKLGL